MEKSNSSIVLTAGSREERIAACKRRLFLRPICAPRSFSMASDVVTAPLSASERTPSTASRAPGILRSANIARICSRRETAAAFIVHPQ